MRGVDSQRRQDGEQLVQELGLQPVSLRLGQPSAADHLDAAVRQFAPQLAPAHLLFGHQLAGRDINPLQLLGRRQAVGR